MDHFLTRHAIFDRESKVYAYEVSFRADLEKLAQKKPKEDQKASKVLTESFFTLGIESITDGKRAFVRFTQNLIINEFALMFPKESIAIVIGEEIPANSKVIAAVKELKNKQQGFETELSKLDQLKDQLNADREKISKHLETIAKMSREDALRKLREELIDRAKQDAAEMVKDIRDRARHQANREAREIVVQAIQRSAADHAGPPRQWLPAFG